METIEERANDYAESRCINVESELHKRLLIEAFDSSYIQGAKEQRKIDIERACDILTKLGVFEWLASDPEEGFNADVYKAQFIQCMKEE